MVPAYQRPYVWNEERQWLPLWEDIERLADSRLSSGPDEHHFLGAIVIRQENIQPGGITEWSVIDGQQRLATLQLLVSALADAARNDGFEVEARRLTRLTLHEEDEASGDVRFRFWPTTVNQSAFRSVMQSSGPQPGSNGGLENTIEEGWHFFRERARDYARAAEDSEEDIEARYRALREAISGLLQLVAISLAPDDPAQLIFETLNARGTPLLATDLVKNALFDAAEKQGHSVDEVHDRYWAPQLGDYDYWSTEERLGRLSVPRSEVFLMHWLTMQLGEVVAADTLFDRFRREFLEGDAVELIATLNKDAGIWRSFVTPGSGRPEAAFQDTVRRLDTTTFHPVALLLLRSNVEPERLARAFAALESFLVRRMLGGLTNKEYNRLSGRLITRARSDLGRADELIIEELLISQADTQRWPTDDDLREHLATHPLYGWVGQARIVMVLSAVELARRKGKTEAITQLPPKLQVEHLLPRAWQRPWPLPEPVDDQAVADRERHLDLLGNLTLVSGNLNASMSNDPWSAKLKALDDNSLLLLNRELKDYKQWSETTIDQRGAKLAKEICALWPGPQDFMPEGWKAPAAESWPDAARMTTDEVRAVYAASSVLVGQLMEELAEHPEERQRYGDIERTLGWPAGRLKSVFGGYASKIGVKYDQRRPWHLHLDNNGIWWMWMDEAAAQAVVEEAESASGEVQTLDDLRARIVKPEVRRVLELLADRVPDGLPDAHVSIGLPRGSVRIRTGGRSVAHGHFTLNWLLLRMDQRFPGDEAWFRQRLSRPNEVRRDPKDRLCIHVVTEADLDAVITAIAEHTQTA